MLCEKIFHSLIFIFYVLFHQNEYLSISKSHHAKLQTTNLDFGWIVYQSLSIAALCVKTFYMLFVPSVVVSLNYPKMFLQDEEPNDRKISKLCEYASKTPLRIPKVLALLILCMKLIYMWFILLHVNLSGDLILKFLYILYMEILT